MTCTVRDIKRTSLVASLLVLLIAIRTPTNPFCFPIRLMQLAGAFGTNKKDSPTHPHHPPTHLTAHRNGDIFSMKEAAYQKKHFHDHETYHAGRVMGDALRGNPNSSTRSADPSYNYKEGAPYYLEGQKLALDQTMSPYGADMPPPPPFALTTELSGELLRARQVAEESPPILVKAREAADKLRAKRFNTNSNQPQDDPVYMCFPDINYRRVLSLTRSEVMAIFQKLGVHSKGGDIEKLWYYMECLNEELTRDKLYVLLGGKLKKQGLTVTEDIVDESSALTLEHRRTLHHVQTKANAIIRGCTATDTDGVGKVSTSVFVKALHACDVYMTDEDRYHILTAVGEKGGMVKYPGIVFAITNYINGHHKPVEVPQYDASPKRPSTIQKMGTHSNLDVGPEDEEGGIDQFVYLKIDAPAPETIRMRESNITKESVLKEGLKDVNWNISSLADRVHFSRNKTNDADINHQLTKDVANILFMERPVLAMCFRQHDDDNKGSLTANQLMELLMSNRLRSGLSGKPKLAKTISLEFFERARKDPNTTDRMDFNEMVNTISTILEEEKAEKYAETVESYQVGTREYGERRNEVRQAQR